ncbi:DNA helicase UvrD (plasmid) [Rhizobium leguminosarum]|uniref:UvrD-helicase domain-containing protein n=1 Tax=Rhizobium leguminosarum TaxID=384 RepID=UPI00102FB8D7|nr:UvrD-helicase domain-containing protein [Rhizobium leguminosarum]TBC60664.1 DNA helicase UvrD [Rhizobium leguminosarum]
MTEVITQNKVDTTIASAGTGKTYSLVRDVVAAVDTGTEPHRIFATTFTKKAAAELAGRIRANLIERGRPDLGAAMLSARIGTVNSVCGGLISEFAFELGRSPVVEVISEDRQRPVFDRAAGPIIEASGPDITDIAERFGLAARGYDSPRGRVRGWQDELRRAVDLARSNGIAPDRMARCAERSADSLIAILPANVLGETAADLNAALRAALENCEVELKRSGAALKGGTRDKDVPIVDKALRILRADGLLGWDDWARLCKLGVTKADAPLFQDVIAAAAVHPRHPALKVDLRNYIDLIFDCAARCMKAYADYKQARGLLDFIDQEKLALEIISNPENAPRLRELIGAVFVDEFQDSSPIQIAIFTALSRIAGRNLWVGDPKQSIYGFRDADPALTSTASAAITAATGGATGYLRRSYRTRPQLADFVNAAIAPNMLRVGMTDAEITFDGCERLEDAEMPAGLSVWEMSGKNKGLRTDMLAARVAGLLDEPDVWPVTLKDGLTRPARGGDIAILCRSNSMVGELATALSAQGLRVAVERSGLLNQPEIEFALAAFRWIADASDTLALAELARLAKDGDDWFKSVFVEKPRDQLIALLPFSAALAEIRDRSPQLTPAEVFDALLHVDGVLATLLAWGAAEQRLQNLEAVRAMIVNYQEEQHSERQAVTLTGACEWLTTRPDPRQPQSRHPDAVNILTYHGAKGLEWPIVILTELDSEAKGSPFGLTAEDETPPDWADPLAARVLRYWPWPYGDQQKNVGLDVSAPLSPQGVQAKAQERLERTRVLYVGLTRARDHLVLATTGGTLAWLDELLDAADSPLVSLVGGVVSVAGAPFPSRNAPAPRGPAEAAQAPTPEYVRPATAVVGHLPLRLRPSDGVVLADDIQIVATERLGARIALVGNPDLQLLGEAIHRFLAADDPTKERADRERLAAQILARWGAPHLSAADLVVISDRLGAFVSNRFGGAAALKEWSVHAEDGLQVVAGRLDLLVDLGDGYAIIDHKSFPGSVTMDQDRLRAFAGQVGLYARALGRVTGRTRFEYWVHQPVAGVMTRIELP